MGVYIYFQPLGLKQGYPALCFLGDEGFDSIVEDAGKSCMRFLFWI